VPKFVADSSVSPTGLKWAVDPVADVVTTAGDLLYGTAADTVARLGIGTANQVLAVNSGATAPQWVTPAGGAVKQVVTFTTTTNTTTTNTLVSSALTASITPTSASSKIIAIFSMPRCGWTTTSTAGASFDVEYRIVRGATDINRCKVGGANIFGTNTAIKEQFMNQTITVVDSPATTSSTTYLLKLETNSGSCTAHTNYAGGNGTMSLTLIEV
jgi:hypothetical protein